MIELPLAIIDGKVARSCVRSGYCCKQAPCGFGKWDTEHHQCAYLQKDGNDRYKCGIAEEIITKPGWGLSPAFGAGCCSPFNTDRQRIIYQTNHSHSVTSRTD